MDIKDLEKLLETTDDKYAVLSNKSNLMSYKLTLGDLKNLLGKFLSDEEKINIIKEDIIRGLEAGSRTYMKRNIVKSIGNNDIKLKLLRDRYAMSDMQEYDIKEIVDTLDDDKKIEFLKLLGEDYQGPQLSEYCLRNIIKNLDIHSKKEVLYNSELIEITLKIKKDNMVDLICNLDEDKDKLDLGRLYKLDATQMHYVIATLSDEPKKRFILENPYGYNTFYLKELLGTLSVDTLTEILKNNKEFFQEKRIPPFEIIKRLKTEEQLKFVSIMENVGLSLEEKRKILIYLNPDAKENIDKSSLPVEYKTALEINVEKDFKNIDTMGKVIVDFSKDLEIYRGLDDIITVNGLKMREEDKEKLLQLCEICPNMLISDNLTIGQSTAKEYKNAEQWIDSVLQRINPNWSDVEKVAYIDSVIGKKISYTPDFGTELFKEGDARALWKIIDSGYGVCNGIAQVEQYILGKLGIKSEMISSNKHAFLRLKDISLPTKNGDFVVGDTLLDPTWNLSNHRFGAMPQNFCVNYQQIRSRDINKDGIDTLSHKNDNLSDVTLSLDEEMLRNIFKTIGLADKDGYFPIKALFDKSEIVDKNGPIEEQISRQLYLLKEYYPNFAMCENSTMSLLESMLLGLEKTSFDKCIINRVYDKSDPEKRPVVYVYADFPSSGKKFYYIDKKQGEFISIGEKEFNEKFECYEQDLIKWEGKRPWQDKDFENQQELKNSSGKIVANEGKDSSSNLELADEEKEI